MPFLGLADTGVATRSSSASSGLVVWALCWGNGTMWLTAKYDWQKKPLSPSRRGVALLHESKISEHLSLVTPSLPKSSSFCLFQADPLQLCLPFMKNIVCPFVKPHNHLCLLVLFYMVTLLSRSISLLAHGISCWSSSKPKRNWFNYPSRKQWVQLVREAARKTEEYPGIISCDSPVRWNLDIQHVHLQPPLFLTMCAKSRFMCQKEDTAHSS